MYSGLIHLPWSFKIIYGLMSDTLPFAGYKRKTYVVLMGLLQFIAFFLAFTMHSTTAIAVTIMLAIAALSEAFVCTVVEAIMVQEARKDPVNGSQNLVSFFQFSAGCGGFIGSILGGYITQYAHPKIGFLIYSFMGLAIAFTSMFLNEE
jgi:MFS family permease